MANIPFLNNAYFAGTVGIGTESPLKKLSINGGDVAVNNGNSFIVGAAITGNTQIGELGADSGQLQLLTESTRDIKFGSTTYGNIMFLEGSNGNVGIGTTSPTAPLHFGKTVYGDPSSENFFRIKFNDAGGVMNDVGIGQPNANSIGWNITPSTDGVFEWNAGTTGRVMNLTNAGVLTLDSYDSTNNTGTPTYLLGTDASGNVVKVLGADIPGVPGGSGTLNTIPLWTPDGDTLGNSIITQPSTSTIDVDGNILISDTGNDKYFGSNVNLILNADADAQSGDSARNIIFQNRGSEKMRITAAGNVGIGVTSPTSRFHIYESINPSSGDLITSKIYSNGTVTANGNTRTGLDVETNRTGWYNSDATSGNFKISNNNRIGNSDLIGVKSLATVDVDNVYSGLTAAGSLTALYGKVTTTYTAGSGPVAKGYGLRIDAPEVATNSEIDTYYGTYIDGATVSGTLTNKYALVTEANAGNVGIGTTSPDARLDVNGGLNSTHAIFSGQDGRGLKLSTENTLNNDDGVVYDAQTSTGKHLFKVSGAEKMRITSAGNVGISNTLPGTKLHVGSGSGATVDTGYQVVIDSAGIAGLQILSATTQSGRIVFGDSGDNDIGMIKYDHTDNSMGFRTNGSGNERMRIEASGNVGIGTTSPSAKLDVAGTGNFTGLVSGITPVAAANFVTKAYVDGSGGGTGPFLPLAGGTMTGSIDFGTNNKDISMTDSAGAVTRVMVLNTSNTMYIGPVDPYAGGSIIYGAAAGVSYQRWYTGASERMRIMPSGNVGIGTTSPQQKLQVASPSSTSVVLGASYSSSNNSNFFETGINANDGYINLRNSGVSTTVHIDSDGDSYLNGGNVGIGTTGPAYKLDVNSSTFVGARIESTAAGYAPASILLESGNADSRGQGIYQYNSVSKNSWFSGVPYSTTSDDWVIAHKLETTAFNSDVAQMSNALFCVNDNGNVGIGTTNPAVKLDVFDPSTTAANTIVAQAIKNYVGGSAMFRVGMNAGSTTADIEMNSGGAGPFRYGSYGEMNIVNNRPTSKINIVNNSSIAATIDSSGNVGIGTTSPTQKLTIAGNARVTGAYYDSGNTPGTANQLLASTATGTDWIDGSAIPGVPAGSGTLNTIPLWTPDGNTLGNSIITQPTSAEVRVGGTLKVNSTVAGYSSTKIQTGGFGDSQSGINILNSTTGYGYILFGDGGGADLYRGQITYKHGDDYMSFNAAGGERMRIDSSGNVMIGNTGAGAKLDVRADTGYAFRTENASGNTFRIEASSGNIYTTGDLYIEDNNKIRLGASSDLQIYHDGSNSYITDTGTGSLFIQGSDIFIKTNSTENAIFAQGNGKVELFHNNITKFETTSTGVSVTGIASAATFSGDLNGTINTATTAVTQVDSVDNNTVATTAYVNNKIQLIPAGLVFQGTWNAATNTPTLTSGTGTTGNFYIVSVAGSTNLDGITDWKVGDWAVFIEQGASDQWEKIDNSSVLDGIGTGGSVAGWSGSGTSNTLTDAPITFTSAKVEIPRNVEIFTGGYPYIDLGVSSSNYFRIIHDNPNDILKIGKNGAATASSVIINPSGNVGIGAVPVGNPGTKFLAVGTAGSVAGGIQLWASSSQTHYLQFGDANSGGEVYRGGIGYNHASETLLLLQASSTALSFTGSQAATFTGSVTAASGTFSNLTSTKFPVAGTGGLLENSILYKLNYNAIGLDTIGRQFYGNNFVTISNSVPINIIAGLTSSVNLKGDGADILVASTGGNVNIPNGKLGIGMTTAPSALLYIKGTGDAIRVESTNTGAGGAQLDLLQYSTSPADGDTMAYVNMGGYYDTVPNQAYFASIKTIATDVSARQGALTFTTRNGSDFDEAMRISPTGNVGIGTTSPGANLDVAGAAPVIRITNTTDPLGNGTVGSFEFFTNDSSTGATRTVSSIVCDNQAGSAVPGGELVFKTSLGGSGSPVATEKMRIEADGTVLIGTASSGYDTTQGYPLHAMSDLTSQSYISVARKGQTSGTEGLIVGLDTANAYVSVRDNIPLILGTNNLSHVFIKPSGYVGINTSTPRSRLQVAGGIQMADDTDTASADKVGTMRYRTGTEYVEVTGTELVTNGDFTTDSGWTKGTGWTIANGIATLTAQGASSSLISANIAVTSGSIYKVVVNVLTRGNSFRLYDSYGVVSYGLAVGINTHYITMSTSSYNIIPLGLAGAFGTIESVSMVEVTAEDASYADMCMQTGSSTYEWVNIVRNTY